ncbi:MAG: C25 family cysteine peptidase, partial [Bacteroidia bacterium]
MKILIFSALFFLFLPFSKAEEILVKRKINWKNSSDFKKIPHFDSEIFLKNAETIPVFTEILDLNGNEFVSAKLIIEETKRLEAGSIISLNQIPQNFSIRTFPAFEKGRPKLIVQIDAISQLNGSVQTLESFQIQITTQSSLTKTKLKKANANSVLATGDWYKLGTTQNGIHRIDYNGLRNMGINPDVIDPRTLKLYGNGAGMLPTSNAAFRYDDLHEIAIQIKGEEDGKFNTSDFILFYGESQLDQWVYNKQSKTYSHQSNLYSDTTYYFLTVSSGNGKRIGKVSSESTQTQESSAADFTYFYENEKTNLTKSGKVWVGEEFDRVPSQNFNLSIPNLILTEPIRMLSSVTSRSIVPSVFAVSVNGTNVLNHNMPSVTGGYDKPFASGLSYVASEFSVNNQSLIVNYNYNKPASGSIGWLDFFEIVGRVSLKNSSGNFVFRDKNSVAANAKTKFNINTNRTLNIWDVSNTVDPFEIEGSFSGSNFSFVCATDSLRRFAVIDGSNYLQPKIVGKILNQNLHALSPAHGIIISHPDFITEANRLAKFHKEFDGLDIHVINIQQIYNEFSSGSQDLSALRDFLKLFYEKSLNTSTKFSDVLLFGRASYDYKNRIKVNSNYVPVFQSFESFDPTTSYC